MEIGPVEMDNRKRIKKKKYGQLGNYGQLEKYGQLEFMKLTARKLWILQM